MVIKPSNVEHQVLQRLRTSNKEDLGKGGREAGQRLTSEGNDEPFLEPQSHP